VQPPQKPKIFWLCPSWTWYSTQWDEQQSEFYIHLEVVPQGLSKYTWFQFIHFISSFIQNAYVTPLQNEE